MFKKSILFCLKISTYAIKNIKYLHLEGMLKVI